METILLSLWLFSILFHVDIYCVWILLLCSLQHDVCRDGFVIYIYNSSVR